MSENRQLREAVRFAVATGLRKPADQRVLATVLAIRDVVPAHQIDQFWVTLIEHATETTRSLLAVHGDELAHQHAGAAPPVSAPVGDPVLRLVNEAFAHASAKDHHAVAAAVARMFDLPEQARAAALGNVVHLALTVSGMVNAHCGTTDDITLD